MSTMDVVTFRPPQGCRGEDGPAFQGNFRKGELRGIIHINKDNCVGCDTCRKFCPVDAISGGLGAIHKIRDDACVSCGQCLSACPFGAIEQMSFVDDVIAALKDPKKFVVAHPSPAVRVALAEEFGGKPGDLCTDQMLNALEKAGFTVYDVNQTADQTILEEGTEFIKKVRYWCLGERSPEVNMMAHHPLPHFTSCCPGWVRNMEINFASAIPHVSTTKSPIQMGGALGKTWAAKHVWNKDPRDVEGNKVMVKERTKLGTPEGKQIVGFDEFVASVSSRLEQMQKDIFAKAKNRLEHNIRTDITDPAEFKKYFAESNVWIEDNKQGKVAFVRGKWSGDPESESILKEMKITIRCIPFDQSGSEGICLLTGKPATIDVIYARSY